MAADVADGFTVANALATLLTTESLLFAALSLTYSSTTGGGRRTRTLPVPTWVMVALALGAFACVAAGAGAAWLELFACDWPQRLSGQVMAVAIAVAIVVQPALAAILALGLREQA